MYATLLKSMIFTEKLATLKKSDQNKTDNTNEPCTTGDHSARVHDAQHHSPTFIMVTGQQKGHFAYYALKATFRFGY